VPNRRLKDGCSVLETERHEELIDWFIDAGVRLRQALAVTPPTNLIGNVAPAAPG
jgi:hypothetical protein